MKRKFTIDELRATLRAMDLTTRGGDAEYVNECERLMEELRPYRERARKVT